MCPHLQGLDGFWRWILEGLHASAPDLFPATGLPGDASGFEEAFSEVGCFKKRQHVLRAWRCRLPVGPQLQAVCLSSTSSRTACQAESSSWRPGSVHIGGRSCAILADAS